MQVFVELASQVAMELGQSGPEGAGKIAINGLLELRKSGALVTELDAMSEEQFTNVSRRVSRQTDTHMKWFVYRSSEGVEMWLHEFRPDDEIRKTDRYAASIHNHRYGFASLLLKGGYTAESYEVVAPCGMLTDGACVSHSITGEDVYTVGDAYFMRYEAFHRLRDFVDDTVSLVVQLPPQTSSSFSVDRSTSTLREHVDFAEDRARMRRAYS